MIVYNKNFLIHSFCGRFKVTGMYAFIHVSIWKAKRIEFIPVSNDQIAPIINMIYSTNHFEFEYFVEEEQINQDTFLVDGLEFQTLSWDEEKKDVDRRCVTWPRLQSR